MSSKPELREKELRRIPEEVQKKRKGLHDGDDEDFNMSPTRRRKIEELTALVAAQQREIDLMRIRAEKAEAELLHLQRSYNLSSNTRVGHGSRPEALDAREGGGVEPSMEKRMASGFGQSKFLSIFGDATNTGDDESHFCIVNGVSVRALSLASEYIRCNCRLSLLDFSELLDSHNSTIPAHLG